MKPSTDSKPSNFNKTKIKKAYTIDVQGWQRKSNEKLTSNDKFSVELDTDSVIKTEVQLDDEGDEIVEARDIAISALSFPDHIADEEAFN